MDTKSVSLSVERAWSRHQNLVRHITWKIVKKYGGDYEELFSEALVLFTEAVQCYEPICGTIQNWIGFRVYKGLLEVSRTRMRRHYIAKMHDQSLSEDMLNGADGKRTGFSDLFADDVDYFTELRKELSDDALHVIKTLFGLDCSFRNKSMTKLTLRSELLNEDGWSHERVNCCFREIEAAVQ